MKTAICTTTRLGGLAVSVWLHTEEDPLDAEWQSGLDQMHAMVLGIGNELHRLRNFVISDGGAPSAAQRKELNGRIYRNIPSKLGVITPLHSPLKRGIATAIAWMNPAFKAAPVENWREVLRHLDLDGETATLLAICRDLQKNIPVLKTLTQLELRAAAFAQPLDRSPTSGASPRLRRS
jgi:hypothetical protein